MSDRSRDGVLALAVTLALIFLVPAAQAQETKVDLELVLAVDSSDSVDAAEFRLQAVGLAAAFSDSEVHQQIAAGRIGAIAITVVEWASTGQHVQRLPWTVIRTPGQALAAATRIRAFERSFERGVTSISGIIDYARALFRNNGLDGQRLVLDISSDGRHNHGPPVGPARYSALMDGVTINGLAITNEYKALDAYFREQVIIGNDAFVEKANGYADYPRAIRAKLLREITNVPTS